VKIRFAFILFLCFGLVYPPAFGKIRYKIGEGDWSIAQKGLSELYPRKSEVLALSIEVADLRTFDFSGGYFNVFENLRELVFDEISAGLNIVISVLTGMKMSENCKKLLIRNSDLTNYKVYNKILFWDIFKAFPGLEELVLHNSLYVVERLTLDGKKRYAEGVESLDLSGINFFPVTLQTLLEKMPKLESLKICNSHGINFTHLVKHENLQKLSLERITFSGDPKKLGQGIEGILKNFSKLEYLKILNTFYLKDQPKQIPFEEIKKAVGQVDVRKDRTIYLHDPEASGYIAIDLKQKSFFERAIAFFGVGWFMSFLRKWISKREKVPQTVTEGG